MNLQELMLRCRRGLIDADAPHGRPATEFGKYRLENYARLALIKSKYDPTNLFRVNQNIRPAAAAV